MSWENWLGIVASIVGIVIPAWAAAKWIWNKYSAHNNRVKLEKYLKKEKDKKEDKGQRTMNHLRSKIPLTEDQFNDAVASSKKIKRRLATDEDGRALLVLYEYGEPES